MDDTERFFRIALLVVAALATVLWFVDLSGRIRRGLLSAGQLLTVIGLLLLLISIVYGQLEQLLSISGMWRLPLVLVGTCWVAIGLATNIISHRRSRRLRASELANRPAQYPSE